MDEPILQVRNLKKYFPVVKGLLRKVVGSVKAVDGVSFDLMAQETISLVGESGCGKTTCGRSIIQLLKPNEGHVIFRGQDLTTLGAEPLRKMRRYMQIIFQDPYSSLNPRQTVGQIIGNPMLLHGLATKDDVETQVRDLLDKVGLQPSYISRYPHEFSGGQRQRLGIARAVALKPDFIVCDEAVSALDVSVQAQVVNLLLDLQEEYSLSYIFIAHDLSVVRHISDRVAVMYLGRIVEFATRDSIFATAMHPYTQALLSAVPHADPRRKKNRIILPGDVPSPINPPTGCHFHTRCPLVEERCRREEPAVHDVAEGHQVRCHLYDGNTELVSITERQTR